MRLFLCEKPSQARDIAAVLGARSRGDGFLSGTTDTVTWGFGHLYETAPPEAYDPALKNWMLGSLPIIPAVWKLEPKPKVKKQLRVIVGLLKKASEVVVATDADREGEVIAREILDENGWRGPVSRLWLSALDPASIKKALADIRPGSATEALYHAGQARSRADWLIGMNLSRAFTVAGRLEGSQGVLSVGRVQTPTLALVVDRDRAIESFKPVPFFDVQAMVGAGTGAFTAQWLVPKDVGDDGGRCLNRAVAEAVVGRLNGTTGTVESAETTRKSAVAPLVFDLATLQQEASAKFGMDAKQVLTVAQALYETHKATTYPRTDCGYLPLNQWADATQVLGFLKQSDPGIGALVDQADPGRRSRVWNDKKITAHHGIIPTAAVASIGAMSPPEAQLYDLIRRRYLAQFFADHEFDDTQIVVEAAGERLGARGRVPVVDGWRSVIHAGAEGKDKAAVALPKVAQGESVRVDQPVVVAKQTKPPACFTDGTLIGAMKSVAKFVTDPAMKKRLRDTAGIGTEATRASIIETLINRALVERKKVGRKKVLVSSATGRSLVDAVPSAVRDPAMTALWEGLLEEVAAGRQQASTFLQAQEAFVTGIVRDMQSRFGAREAAATHHCPSCGALLIRRQSKKGKKGFFWGCSGYPACEVTLPDEDGKPGAPNKASGRGGQPKLAEGSPCPDCDDGRIVRKSFTKGKSKGKPFLACSNYPKCDYFGWP